MTVRHYGARLIPVIALGLVALPLAGASPVAAEDVVPPGQFTLTGSGFGHAVGLSQWGAYGMAKAGYDATGIVTYYYSGTTVTPVQDDMDARINLLYHVSATKVRSEALDPTGGAIEVTVGPTVVVGGPADEFRFAVNGAAVSAQRITAGVPTDLGTAPSVTVRWAGTRSPGTAPGGPTLLDVVGSGASLDSSGHRYRYGYVEVLPVSTASGVMLNVVNAVRVHDEYLYGISEVSSSWPAAAQQAQVLAARSYAISKVSRGVRQACSCHMDDGGGPYADQTFTGWGKASAAKGQNWVDAVNATLASETTGLAILYENAPISAFYSASSGGATQSVQDVWGGTLPYAVSVPDPWMQVDGNPERSWTVAVPQSRMASVFGVGAVAAVDVAERYVSGAVKRVAATLPDGTVVTRTGSQFQGALRLKSMFVTAVDGDAGAALPVPPAVPVPVAVPAAEPAPIPVVDPVPVSTIKQRTVSLLTPVSITVKSGRHYRVVGVVRPAKAMLNVFRQVLVDGQWKTLQRTKTSAKGRYRFAVDKTKAAGSTRTYRVLVLKKGNVVGVSSDFTVVIAPRK